jgi:hypothetical protein
MLLENLKKESLELLNYFKNEKKFYEKIIKNLEIINIYSDIESKILEINNNFFKYNSDYEKIRSFLNKIMDCEDLNCEDIKLKKIIEEFLNTVVQYIELVTNNYNHFESSLDSALNCLNKNTDNTSGENENLLNNIKVFKKYKINLFYIKFLKSLQVSYEEYIYLLENRINKIF